MTRWTVLAALLTAVGVLTTGCVTPTDGSGTAADRRPATETTFDAFVACIDTEMPVVSAGTRFEAVEDMVGDTIVVCKDSHDAFVAALLRQTMRENRWTSLDPRVRPTVHARVAERTRTAMANIYFNKSVFPPEGPQS